MKKKQLLKMLRQSIIMCSTDGFQDDYKNYYNSIECTLYVFSDNADVDIPAIKGFKSQTDFENFVRSNSSDKIKELLSNILAQVQMWVKERPAEVAVLCKMSHAKKVWFGIFTAIIIATIIAAIVFEGLKLSGKFNEALYWVSDAVDGLGLVTGLAFFLYEKIDDVRKNKIHGNTKKTGEEKSDKSPAPGESTVASSVFGPANVDNSTNTTYTINNYYGSDKKNN